MVAIRTSKLSNSWPVFFGSDSLWPRMSRAPFEDSKTSGQRLEKLKSNLARLNIKLIWVQIQFKRSEHRPNLWEERHARLWDWIAKRHEMWEARCETQHSFTFSTPSSNTPSCGLNHARSCRKNFLKEMQMKLFSQNIKEPWEIPAYVLNTIDPAKALMLKPNKCPTQNKTRKPCLKTIWGQRYLVLDPLPWKKES